VLSAIGSSIPASTTGGGTSAAVLQAQLDRYQNELSDCVNCASAKTAAGKTKIAEISNKISDIQGRIDKIFATKTNSQPTALNVRTSADITTNKHALASEDQRNNAVVTVSALGSESLTIGSNLNVFA
jgi:hypothetical protein